ncbi:MAG TPA: hypothetical protein VN822_10350 [Candidatus Acidoferrales bacterium]|nr:hypothetical protein [Candidatus Acidoferrales bacterium]
MRFERSSRYFSTSRKSAAALAAGLLWVTVTLAQTSSSSQPGTSDATQAAPQDQPGPTEKKEHKSSEPGTTKLRIRVTANDKPVSNASVYVRYYMSGGFLRHEKLAELNFKTNLDGSVKVPEIPQGKILIQVIATGWHTYGKWYDVDKDEETIPIALEPPPHWY